MSCGLQVWVYLQGPLEKTPASQHRMSSMRLWACSVARLPSVRRHKASSSFSWKSGNCSIAQRWTLRSTDKTQVQSEPMSSLENTTFHNKQLLWTSCWEVNVLILGKNGPFFGNWRLLKPSDGDWDFLQQVTATQVLNFLRLCWVLSFPRRSPLLQK